MTECIWNNPQFYLSDCHQVEETVNWLSDYFLRSRLSKADLRSFGLYSAWVPYISDVVTFWEHLTGCLINTQVSSCTREPVGSNKVTKGKNTNDCKSERRKLGVIDLLVLCRSFCLLSL